AAAWLANEAAQGEPAETETFELAPVGQDSARTAPPEPIVSVSKDEGPAASARLPKVVYVFQIHSHQRPTVAGEPLLYGDNARHLLPVLLHPNEVLDGAVLQGYNARGTYIVQNHPVILELYRRHGDDLDFGGVVAVVAHQTAEERERSAVMASNLVA